MPIPMLPPPPPFVAPDLRPIVARDEASLTFLRGADGRVVGRDLSHGLWIAAEGAPLELRFHRRADGTVWGEQATYPDGDRQDGIARASAAAHVETLSRRMVGAMGTARNVVRYSIVDSSGATRRSWTASACGAPDAVRLDRADSPTEPTFLPTWWGCGGGGSAYVLGRQVALDRGWAMRAPVEVAASVKPITAGSYTLRVELDPLQGIAQSDRSNDVATVPLEVRTGGVVAGDGEGLEVPAPPEAGSMSRHAHDRSRSEPAWYATALRDVEGLVEARRMERARNGRAGDGATAAPENVDLPDLRAAPSYGIEAASVRGANGRRDLLRFGALTWNAGPGVLEVEAFRESGATLSAYQVFHRDGERAARQPRGTLIWHAAPGHDHFHFSAFARYQLTDMAGTVLRDGGKHSWCIVDTDLVDSTRPGAGSGARGFDSTSGCGSEPGSLWARLSLSVGAGDYYGPDLAGQAFDVTGLPNGSYRIRIEANPTSVIAESDYANNVSTRVVRLGGRPGRRVVAPRSVATLDEDAVDECYDC